MPRSRRTTVAIIALLLFFFAGGVYLSARMLIGDGVPLITGNRVAVLPIQGILTSEKEILRHLQTFRRDATVRAFVLEIRSPGGGVGASQAVYAELRRLKKEDDRPLVAWMGDVAASGGYYVSLPADSIFALPGTITGSIGVIMEFPNVQELLRNVGVGWEVVKSGEHKDIGSPARPLTDEDRQILEDLVRDVWEQFVQAVVESRGLDRERVVELADGRVFTGQRAVELGLVDGIGSLEEAIDAAGRMSGLGERPATVRPRERRLGLLDLFLGVPESRLRALASWLPNPRATPRLLYEWR